MVITRLIKLSPCKLRAVRRIEIQRNSLLSINVNNGNNTLHRLITNFIAFVELPSNYRLLPSLIVHRLYMIHIRARGTSN